MSRRTLSADVGTACEFINGSSRLRPDQHTEKASLQPIKAEMRTSFENPRRSLPVHILEATSDGLQANNLKAALVSRSISICTPSTCANIPRQRLFPTIAQENLLIR